MKRYLLDTNAAGGFVRSVSKIVDRVRDARMAGCRVGICVPVLAELRYGVEYSDTCEASLRKLKSGIKGFVVWPFDSSAAFEYGRIAADLRRRGRAIPIVDAMVAAIAKTLGNTTVVSTDSDFQAIPGLDVEDWTK